MKFHRNMLIFGILSLTAAVSGCKWDDDLYEDYITKDQQVVSCPPWFELDEDMQFYISFDHLRCYEYQIDPLDAEINYPEEYRLCRNYQTHWNRLHENYAFIGGTETIMNMDAFDHSICPADYPICSFDMKKNSWGCLSCLPGYAKCNSVCINPLTDSDYCGADITCETYTKCAANERCLGGRCIVDNCANGLKLCGESDCRNIFGNDINNCGACNYRCADHELASATSNVCTNGVCMYQCKPGYTYCGGSNTANQISCIANERFAYDNENCGNCSVKCREDQVCINGICQTNTCQPGLMLCALDDCRNIHGDDINNCGACNYQCPTRTVPHAIFKACSNGQCTYECEEGFANIGSATAPNCINPLTEQHHCGKYDGLLFLEMTDCGVNPCVDGECKPTHCEDPNMTLCQIPSTSGESPVSKCIDLRNSKENCGYCGFKCPEPTEPGVQLKACENSQCVYECQFGTVNCPIPGSDQINCVDPALNSNHCGSCDNACGPNQYCLMYSCIDSTCEERCPSSGSTTCSPKGCQTNDCSNSVNRCGTSCTDCINASHGEAGYTSCDFNRGVCMISKCQHGYHLVTNLDGTNFCVRNSNLSCGSRDKSDARPCQMSSSPAYVCSDDEETCVMKCRDNYHPNAEQTACEPDTLMACGRYDRSCSTPGINSAECVSGVCRVHACNAGFHLKKEGENETCVRNTPTECGEAQTNCLADLYHAENATCNYYGKCSIHTCKPGFHYVYKEGSYWDCEKFVCELYTNRYVACEPNTQTSCGPASDESVLNCDDYADGNTKSRCNQTIGLCTCASQTQSICTADGDNIFRCRDACDESNMLYY